MATNATITIKDWLALPLDQRPLITYNGRPVYYFIASRNPKGYYYATGLVEDPISDELAPETQLQLVPQES